MTIVKTSVDAWTNKVATSANHGEAAYLGVNGDGTNTRYAYIFFPRPFPLDASIFSATMTVTLFGTWAAQTLTAKRITEAWTELGITWTNQPAVSTTNSAAAAASGTTGTTVDLDLTAMLTNVSAGSPWYGVRLETSGTSNVSLYAAENPQQTYRAALDVDWSVNPDAALNLNPAGSQAVSLAQPTLDWQFASKDHTAKRQQAQSQVQVSTSTDFTTPEYNSGMVANTDSQWDLSGTAETFAADAVRYWRVRVKDDAGQTSDWSDTERFQRKTQGTLTVSNPPAPASNQVSETTPAITWSLSGRTQEAFELVLSQYDGTRKQRIWHLPKTVSTATSYSLPAGYLKSTETYNILVRTWDTIDRATTKGDPPYVSLSRDFTYVRAGGVTGTTNLTATPFGPAVALTWQRTTTPDYFCLKVDGVEVDQRIVPADVFTSGTSYAMNYYEATPRVSSTYEVEAVVLTAGVYKHSSTNDTKTATIDPRAVYLIDPDANESVQMVGTDAPDLTVREVATTFDLAGSRVPVRITDSVAGYSGGWSGEVTSAAARDKVLNFKGRLKELRLVVGDVNMAIFLEDVSVAPRGDMPPETLYDVSLSFFQTDAVNTFAVTGGD